MGIAEPPLGDVDEGAKTVPHPFAPQPALAQVAVGAEALAVPRPVEAGLGDLDDATDIDDRPHVVDGPSARSARPRVGAELDEPVPAASASQGAAAGAAQNEPPHLPAVLIDDSLASGKHPIRADEPTFRVARAAATPAQPMVRRAPPPKKKPSIFSGWRLPLLVVAALGTLFLGMYLAIWLLE